LGEAASSSCEELCHNCDTKPVFTAKTDVIDSSLLLIVRNLLKTQRRSKIPAYRLAASSYVRFIKNHNETWLRRERSSLGSLIAAEGHSCLEEIEKHIREVPQGGF
jgi:hypothetical protein